MTWTWSRPSRFALAFAFALAQLLAGARPAAAADPGPRLELADDDAIYRCKKLSPSTRIRVTLKPEATLEDLVAWVMGFSCKNFVYGTGAGARSQKVTLVTPAEMSAADAYRLFLSSLSVMGLTVVPRGKALEIVEQSRAGDAPLEIVDGTPGSTHMPVRVVIKPRVVALADLALVLGSLKSQHGQIVTVTGANLLLVTDNGETIARMLEVLPMIDVARRAPVLRLELRHADAATVAGTLGQLWGQTPPLRVVPDPRTNAILLVGPEEHWPDGRDLVTMLDAPAAKADPKVHVVRLQYADAEQTLAVLQQVFGGSGAPAPAPTAAPVKPEARTDGAPRPVTGTVRMSFAKATNAIVVVASDEDFRSISAVLRDLDIQRPQVYVEAVIMEMSLERTRAVGTAFHGGKVSDGNTFVGAFQPDGLSSIVVEGEDGASAGLLQNLAVGVFGPSFELFGITVPSLGALFQVAQGRSDVNVLAMPQLLATDHEEARFAVGQNVPYKSTLAVAGPLGQQGESIQRENIELSLKITPQIGAGRDVTLELSLHIKELGKPAPEGLGPTWTTRDLDTMVTVRDGQPIVLGGLLSEVETSSRTSVPLLGDVPLLGVLFRRTEHRREKRNLLIVLVPTVLPDALAARRLYDQKMRERAEFARAYAWLERQGGDENRPRGRGLVADIDAHVRRLDEETDLRAAEADEP
jgi:general secretion pathway protein D